MSSTEHALVYEVGIDGKKPCSHCQSLIHKPWCEVKKPQEWARQYKAKAESATSEAERKKALWDYNRMVDNLKIFINLNYTLENTEPLPEVKSRLNVSREKYEMLYKTGLRGFNLTCPHCGSVIHEGWCAFALLQKMANEAKTRATAATTPEERKKAIIDFHVCEDNLLASYEQKLKEKELEREETERQAQAAARQNVSPPTYQHLSSVDLKNGYDKKLGYGDWATAYGKTFPNGQEQWVLYDQDGQEVGQFSKVEPMTLPNNELDVFLVRDFNGKCGVYNSGGYAIVPPEFESVKALVAQQEGQNRLFYDVTQRDELGVLRHGIINGAIASDDNQTIPCACDRVELLDRSPSNRGVLAKFTVNGGMGVIDADSGDVLIQPGYSYVNTYFTPKGMYLIVGDGTQFGAYYAATMEVVVSPDTGKTLDQVKSNIDQRDR